MDAEPLTYQQQRKKKLFAVKTRSCVCENAFITTSKINMMSSHDANNRFFFKVKWSDIGGKSLIYVFQAEELQ